jgi:opacity protein-like surface antigen
MRSPGAPLPLARRHAQSTAGGLAFSRDQIDRTQLSGTAGRAVAGDVDTELLTRWGVTIGAGVELGLTPKLSVKLEYRFYDYPSSGVSFVPDSQHYNSDLIRYLRTWPELQAGGC